MPGISGLPVSVFAAILTVVIANLGNNIVAPVMPSIRDHFGTTAAEVGLVASGFGLGRLIMDLPSGYLTDRVSPTKLFALAIVMSASASALAAISTNLVMLILFRTIMGLGSALIHTVALVLLVGVARPDQRGSVLALFTSGLLMGQALSPAIGGYLDTLFGWQSIFVFCALTPLVSIPLNLMVTSRAAAARRPADAAHTYTRRRSHAAPGASTGRGGRRTNWPALVTVYVSSFVNFFNRQAMRGSIFPLYGAMVLGIDTLTIGNILTIGSVATILVTMPFGAAGDRFGKKRLLIPGMLILCVGNFVLLSGSTQMVFTVATVFVSMGVLANSMQGGLVADLLPERMLGRGLGMYRFTADLGMVVGPVVLGFVVDSYGFSAALAVGAAVVLAGTVAIIALVPNRTSPVPVEQ